MGLVLFKATEKFFNVGSGRAGKLVFGFLHQLLLLGLRPEGSLGQNTRLLGLVVIHLLEVANIPKFDPRIIKRQQL